MAAGCGPFIRVWSLKYLAGVVRGPLSGYGSVATSL